MSFGHFDDKNREYVITNPQNPLAVDQLFWAMKISFR
jgi:hypothetical protein